MVQPKHKVLAYITRDLGKQLLVFEHMDFPHAGIQVPAGTVEASEDFYQAIKREVEEESGLILLEKPISLGSFPYFRADNEQHQVRHVFLFNTNIQTDKWIHIVSGTGPDNGMRFSYYWMALDQAKEVLVINQGDYLPTF
jgi:8-oxo-dGTP diphosphatase